MSLPRINLTVIDPGSLARPSNVDQTPIYAGVCESGDYYVVQEFAREEDLLAGCGAGHLTDTAQAALQTAESVKVMRLPVSDAGVFEESGTDSPLTADTFSGTPLQFLKGQVIITQNTGNAAISAGTVKARLSLDAWDVPFVDPSFNEEFTIAATGIVVLPGTGGLQITLTTSQTPSVGDTLDFEATPGHYNSTAIGNCLDPLLGPLAGYYTYVVFTGDAATASAANTLAGAVISLQTSLYSRGRFISFLIGTGLETDTDVITAFSNTTADPPFVSAGYGAAYWQSPRPTPTRGRFALREHDAAGIVIANLAISTDPGRAANGPIVSIRGVDYDAALEGSSLHDARISVFRNWQPMSQGYFIARQRMLMKSDSNFESWQFAAVMCFALRAVQRALFRFGLESLRRTATSTLDPRDAIDVKTACETEIDADLVKPQNVRGMPGHISARKVTVSLTEVLPSLSVSVVIRPFGYPTDLRATLEYGNAD